MPKRKFQAVKPRRKLVSGKKIKERMVVQIHFQEDGSLSIIPTSEKAMAKFVNLMLSNAFEMMQTMIKKGKELKIKKSTKKVQER